MEFLFLLLLIIVAVSLYNLNTTLKKFIKEEKHSNRVLYKTMENITNLLNEKGVDGSIADEDSHAAPVPKKPIEPTPVVQPLVEIKKTIIPEKLKTEESSNAKEEVISKDKNGNWPLVESKALTPKAVSPSSGLKKKEKRRSFLDQYPDIEKFIGENLINKIGIVILVLGVAYLVKYAIDQNWINEIGRVAIGIFSAAILIGTAHKLRENYIAFSSVLIGGGLAVLYFTITLAYHTPGYPLYGMQTASFIILTLITLFAVVLSILYNRMEIAILALIGGFGAPLMLSNGSGNYIVLFSYLMILNVGMLALSYFKKWRAINIIAFIATMILFSSWLTQEIFNADYSSLRGAVLFATGFYIIFFLMNIVYNLKYSISFKAAEISLLLSNTFIYFSLMMIMLNYINDGAYKGIYSILLAGFNFGFAYYINKTKRSDSNLLYLLIGLVFTFVTLAIPLQLEGNYITLFWAVEAVLLLWLGQRSGFDIMKLGSVAVTALMLISWVMDLNSGYVYTTLENGMEAQKLSPLLNKLFITSVIVASSLIATLKLLKKENVKFGWLIPIAKYQVSILVISLAVVYIGGLSELNYQTHYYCQESSSQMIFSLLYNALFVLLLLLLTKKVDNRSFSIAVSGISAFFMLFFLSALGSVYYYNLYVFIENNNSVEFSVFVARWLSYLVVLVNSVLLFMQVKQLNKENSLQVYRINFSFFIVTILVLLSTGMDAIALITTQNYEVLQVTQKVGYTILWGITSFLLMIVGMKRKIKFVRIMSLLLFAVTIAKLFIYDINNISEGGKIVAFILLGILLLVISFMYQKVKRLIIDDEPSIEKENIS